MHLAVIDEKGEFARLGEVRLSREEGNGREAVVAGPCHGRGGDCQKCASQAVSGRMHFAPRGDGVDRGKRRHNARSVIIYGNVAIFGAWITPGDTENGMASSDEITNERILWRQIENVVFHDPGR